MIPSWHVLIKLAFARIFCREVYRKMARGMFGTCVHCGVKLISGILIIGFAVYTPTYAELSRAQCDAYESYQNQYRWMNWNKFWPIFEHVDLHGLPPELAFAVVDAESDGNENAFNQRSGATGPWQLLPQYHYKGKDPRDLRHWYRCAMRGAPVLKWAQDCANKTAIGQLLGAPLPHNISVALHLCHTVLTLRNYERGPGGKGINIRYTLKVIENIRGTI